MNISKFRSFTAIALLSTTLSVSTAYADERVFLLQLGSFESQSEANARWMSLKDTYTDLLEGLDVRLLDVTLPPDNFTVYRTQAGALNNRADAEIICERLNARGDECYVVETAMFSPQAAASRQPSISPMAMQAPAIDVPEFEAPTFESQSFAPAEMPSFDSSNSNVPASLLAGGAAASSMAAEAPQAAPEFSMQPGEGLEPLNDEDSESFWSWINPFKSREPEMVRPALTAPSVDTYEMAVPVQAIQAAPQPALMLPPPPAPPAGYVTPPIAQQVAAPLTVQTQAPQVVAPQAQAQLQMQAPQIASAQPSLPANLPFQVKRDGKLVGGQPTGFVAAGEEVMVAEAVSVPVSSGNPVPAGQMVGRLSAAQHRSLGLPSESVRDKTLWAEMRYFNSQQSALSFWEKVRRANPSLPPLRVRVTNPHMTPDGAKPKVSLRVGPFEFIQQIEGVCSTLPQRSVYCGLVNDLGGSTSAGSTRYEGAVSQQTERYKSKSNAPEMYWLQLGGYETMGEANAAWRLLSMRHEPLLNEFKPNIVTPSTGSSLSTVYRLRAGPFQMRPVADAMCRQLKNQGTKCRTVFAQ